MKPTKDEIFRDFRVFKLNHDEEILFRHDYFSDIMNQEYGVPHAHLKSMKDIEQVMLAHPLSNFVDVLRQCDAHVRSKGAKLDLCSLLSYAKEGL